MSVEHKHEVLIIGGGVIGVWSALHLNRLGYRVALVEKSEFGSGASHGNACWVAVAHSMPLSTPEAIASGMRWMFDPKAPFAIHFRPRLNLYRWLWQFQKAATAKKVFAGTRINLDLSRKSLAQYRELSDGGLDFGFSQKGLLHVHLSEKARIAGEKELAYLRPFGVDGHLVRRVELRELEPGLSDSIKTGIFYPEPAQLLPRKMVHEVAKLAEREGVTLYPHRGVTRFETQGGQIIGVETDQGKLTADMVVLAAGAWSSRLAASLGIYLCMEPAKGYSITAKRPTPLHGPSRAVAVDDYKLAVSPMGSDFRFSSTLELAGFNPSINRTRLNHNIEGLNRVYSGLESLAVKEEWSGYRPLSADSLPLIGKVPGLDNLIVATGHGMLGITQGPVSGKLVAQLIHNQTPEIDLEPLRPHRF